MTILPGQVLALGTDTETQICRAIVGVEPADVAKLTGNLTRRKVVIVDMETAHRTNVVGSAMALSWAITSGNAVRMVETQRELDHHRRELETSRDAALRILTDEVLCLRILLGQKIAECKSMETRLNAALHPDRLPGEGDA
ncbi:hypothetical protein Ga0100231_023860 [Opitutaceae bacterium TAV4]|nr:hypothetical protein Ga0100231_023860 [Opitutaceae bacterium TAV4]RRK00748.1 hypothetical protein Ga0100230_023435 [Opitutaceae bacterium TAV3]